MKSTTTTEKERSQNQKPHAVCVPCPAQGHITPMLHLAKLLHSRGFHVTFVNSDYNHRRLLRSQGPTALDGLPSFRFESIPDGLPPGPTDDVTQDVPSLCRSTELHCLGPFRNLLARLNEAAAASGGGSGGGPPPPPVTCVVADMAMFFTIDAAKEIGVPAVMLWTASAAGLLWYTQYDNLVDKGIVPFKDENYTTNGELDKVLDWVPCANGIRLKDIPTFMRTTDPNDFMLNFVRRVMSNNKRASAILLNTFDALDHETLQFLSSDFPPLYAIGPLHLMASLIEEDELTKTSSIRSNLWKEDSHCLTWLDSHNPSSVVYVNFGSITVMTDNQLVEFAWGLADSNQPFLWIIRPDLVTGDSAVLPHEFLSETKDRGLIASWCDQEKVLAHPAIGGFLTHCGWNSMVESISNGVPMICWPFFAEQQTNCWYCCTKWGIGAEIDVNVRRSEIERQVRELMEGAKRKEMTKKAKEWKELAQEATRVTIGSSYLSLENAIKVLLSQN